MGNIKFSYKNGKFSLSGIQGEKIKERIFQTKHKQKDKFNFYREGNNFGYVSGSILFNRDCNNNIVISNQKDNLIFNTSNSLVLINGGYLE